MEKYFTAAFGLALCTLLAFAAAAQNARSNAHGKRYIVSYENGAAAAAALRQAGAQIARALPRHNAVAAHVPEAALQGLRHNPNIVHIEEDPIRYAFAETVPYGIDMVQASLLSDVDAGAITVCIIDSGYYADHEDLQDVNVTASVDSGSGNPLVDDCGHGTHVAGTIAALANGAGVVGVNPSGNLNLHIVKVFGGAACDWTYTSNLVAALDECAGAGANIVSMSLGGSFKSRTEQRAFDAANRDGVLSIAAAGNDGNTRKSYPASYGSVVSVAAIDSGKALADFSQRNSAVELSAPGVGVLSTVPWLDDNSVTVNGTKYVGNHIEFAARGSVSGSLVDGGLCDAVGSWSGAVVLCERGSISFYDKVVNAQAGGAAAAAIYNNEPGLFSGTLGDNTGSSVPTVGLSQEDGQALVAGSLGATAAVQSTFAANASGYEAWSGTSMATPHVSGVAALVWSNFPTASNQELRDALTGTAEDLGAPGRDDSFGYGLVRAQAALDDLASGPTCTPTEGPETSCSDGQDNDCDGLTDGSDSDCGSAGGCDLGQRGDPCTANSDCCSQSCKGKPGRKSCK